MLTTAGEKMQSKTMQRLSAYSAIIAPISFIVLAAAESLLRHSFSQTRDYISDLGIGPFSIIQNTSFLIFGTLAIIFAFGLSEALPKTRSRAQQTVKGLLVVFGLGIIFAGLTLIFPIGPYTSAAENSLHQLASVISFLTIIVAQIMTWQTLRGNTLPAWRIYKHYSLISGVASLAALFTFSALQYSEFAGAMERLFIAVPWLWIEVSGFMLYKLSRKPS